MQFLLNGRVTGGGLKHHLMVSGLGVQQEMVYCPPHPSTTPPGKGAC